MPENSLSQPLAGRSLLETGLEALRSARWLTEDRARIYGRMIAVLVGIQAVNLFQRIVRSALTDPHFRAEPTDFDTFWAAARLCLESHAALAYEPHAMQAAEAIGAQPAPGQFFPYLNPPIFLLFCLPLGLLPYLPAMAVFVAGGYAAIVACLRRILPAGWPSLTVFACPVIMLNGTFGQNGCLSAACFAGGMMLLDRSPVWAGICLGGLAYKPHLALCVPVALLAARRWRALVACGATAVILGLLSWAALGSAPWIAFLHASPAMWAVLDGHETWPRMLSTYAAVRILHGTLTTALACQAAVTLLAIGAVVRLTWRRPGGGAEMAMTASAAMLCTPYVLDYDLVVLAVPMAWLAGRGSMTGWRPWEKILLGLLYMYPLEARNLNLHLGLPVAPLLLAGFLAVLATRIAREMPANTRRLPGHARSDQLAGLVP